MYLGVDLGTTFCAVAAVRRGGELRLFEDPWGHSTTPSVLYFGQDGSILYGREAQEKLWERPEGGAQLFKQWMGRGNWYLLQGEQRYEAADLSSLLLGHLFNQAEEAMGEAIEGVVVTVPAYFSDAGRRDTSRAARQTGVELLGLLNEPTAAAIAYGLQELEDAPPEMALVFDLGGGTLDVTVLQTSSEELKILASVGDTELGGRDWDDALALLVADRFQMAHGHDPMEDPRAFERLRRLCQRSREILSTRPVTPLRYEHEGETLHLNLRRDTLEELTASLVLRCKETLRHALDEASIKASRVQRVLLSGGGSRMPMIQNMLRDFFGRAPEQGLHPESCVAQGAALRALHLASLPAAVRRSDADKRLPGSRIREVTSHALGLLVLQEERLHNRLLVQRKTPLPTSVTCHELTTSRDEQTSFELYLLQGETPHPTRKMLVDAFLVTGIPPLPAGQASLSLTFHYDALGHLQIEGVEQSKEEPLVVEPLGAEEGLDSLFQPPEEDILLVIDCSSSMEGAPMLEAKYMAARLLEERAAETVRFGLLAFGSPTIRLRLDLGADSLLVRAYLHQLKAQGAVSIAEALEEALDLLDARHKAHPQRQQTLVLFSDGEEEDLPRLRQLRHRALQQGIALMAVGTGPNAATERLRHEICTAPNLYRHVDESFGWPGTHALPTRHTTSLNSGPAPQRRALDLQHEAPLPPAPALLHNIPAPQHHAPDPPEEAPLPQHHAPEQQHHAPEQQHHALDPLPLTPDVQHDISESPPPPSPQRHAPAGERPSSGPLLKHPPPPPPPPPPKKSS